MKIRGSYATFPKHYRNVLKKSGLKYWKIAEMLGISLQRFTNILSDTTSTQMDNTEFRNVKKLVQSLEKTMQPDTLERLGK